MAFLYLIKKINRDTSKYSLLQIALQIFINTPYALQISITQAILLRPNITFGVQTETAS